MAFWGAEVKPGKPYTHSHDEKRGRLRVCQATLGNEVGKGGKGAGKSVVQCNVGDNSPILLCSLIPNTSETCHLELEFEEEEDVIFSVLGPRSVHLSGFYLGPNHYNGGDEADMYGEDISETDSEASENSDSEDDEYDSDFIDDDDMGMFPSSPQRKSSVIIEEIPDDDKPANGDRGQKGSKKNQVSDDDDNSQCQLVVKPPPSASLESEDEDGFPVSFSASKKRVENSSKKNKNINTNDDTSTEDRKRKSDVISDHPDSSRNMPTEERAENDGLLKKKKKTKDKRPSETDSKIAGENVSSEQKESKEKDLPVGEVDVSLDAKQKKKKTKKEMTSDADSDQQADKKSDAKLSSDNNHAKEATLQEAKKKKKKNKNKKNHEKDVRKNQVPGDLVEPQDREQPVQTRTFGNGLIIEEVAMGKPDGKKASRGCKVSVNYIGKLKNGTIFDSNVGKRPFQFRLGVGQVIKGWDIGVNGMRVGDKRRLTIPPSMGYGDNAVGKIPKNSTLVFDVELVDVK